MKWTFAGLIPYDTTALQSWKSLAQWIDLSLHNVYTITQIWSQYFFFKREHCLSRSITKNYRCHVVQIGGTSLQINVIYKYTYFLQYCSYLSNNLQYFTWIFLLQYNKWSYQTIIMNITFTSCIATRFSHYSLCSGNSNLLGSPFLLTAIFLILVWCKKVAEVLGGGDRGRDCQGRGRGCSRGNSWGGGGEGGEGGSRGSGC